MKCDWLYHWPTHIGAKKVSKGSGYFDVAKSVNDISFPN